MKKRLISAAVGSAVGVVVLSFSNLLVLEITGALLTAVAIYEIFKTAGLRSHRLLMCIAWLFGAVIIFTARGSLRISVLYPAVLFFASVIVTAVLRFGKVNPESLMTVALFCAYITAGMYSLVYVRGHSHGLFLLVMVLCSAWLTDAGAYFVGSAFGKHKIAPELSPKKTVEGAVGGILTTLILGLAATYIYTRFVNQIGVNYLLLAVTLAVSAVVSMFGDLFASSLKRWYKVKDYGNIMPGHGGVLDRFDSVLAVAPLFAVALNQFSFIM